MSFDVAIYDRNDAPVLLPAGCTAIPERWAAESVGGPSEADIRIEGPREALLSLFAWLGYQAHILNESGAPVWWGDIESIELTLGGLVYGLSLRNFANRVQVRYTAKMPGGTTESADTAWAQNDLSVTRYGTFERRLTASKEMRAAEAEYHRSTALRKLASPQPTLRPTVGSGDDAAVLRCTGYWQRLGRTYYANGAGLIEHDASGTAYPLGLGFQTTRLSWVSSDGNYSVHDVTGKFKNFNYPGLEVAFTGTTSNNGIKTVQAADGNDPVTYTSDYIHFAANDDMFDGYDGFGFISVGDVVLVSGAAQPENNGTRLIKTASVGHAEASPGWGSGFNNSGGWGPSVTVQRGNSITVSEFVTNENAGATTQTVTAYGQGIYQTFIVPTSSSWPSWTVDAIEVRLRKVGTPTDDLRLRLYTYSGGALATLLETVLVDPDDIDAEMDWHRIECANSTTISDGTTYAIELSRTGSNDPDNYFELELDEDAGYTGQTLRMYDGSTWQTPNVLKSLIFRVVDALDNATQVQRIWQLAGNGLVNLSIENTAGVASTQYREGDMTGLDDAVDLLSRGTSAGLRLLTKVDAERYGRLYDEDASTAARFLYRADRTLRTLQGDLLDGFLPAGEWVHLDGYDLPGAWAALSPIFVKRAEYRPGDGLTVEPDGMDEEVDIGLEVG